MVRARRTAQTLGIMENRTYSKLQTWGSWTFVGVCVVGLGFRIAEDVFPGLRPQSNAARNFCNKLAPEMGLDNVQKLVNLEQRSLSGRGDHLSVRFDSGCVCSIELSQTKVISNAVLCTD